MRRWLVIGMLAVAPSVAFPAYLARLDSGATITVDRYWRPAETKRVALECGGVTLILPESRIRGLEPLQAIERPPVIPAARPAGGAPAVVTREALEERLQATAKRLLYLQMDALETEATGTPDDFARVQRKLTRTRALRADLDRRLTTPAD